MTKTFADLTEEDHAAFHGDLSLAIALDDALDIEPTNERPVSLSDLYRYADDADNDRNGLVRRAIQTDAAVAATWNSILSSRGVATFAFAAAAAPLDQLDIVLTSTSGQDRITASISGVETDLWVLRIELQDTNKRPPERIVVSTNDGHAERNLPAPYDGVIQIDLHSDSLFVRLLRSRDVIVETW